MAENQGAASGDTAGTAAADSSGNAGGNAGAGNAGGNAGENNGGGAPAEFKWTEHFKDPLDHKKIEERGWKTPADMLKSYTNLEKFTGVPAEQIIKIPKSDDAGEWGEVYKKLGRPEDPTGYKLPIPEGDNGEFAKTASTWFHEAGLSQGAAAKVAERWNEHLAKTMEAESQKANEEFEAEVKSLQTEWGSEYQSRAQLVERAAQAFKMDGDTFEALKASMGPKRAMNFMYDIGSKLGVEDVGLHGAGEGGGGFSGLTPEMAVAEIESLNKDKNFSAQFTSKDPKVQAEARARMKRLHRIAYPDRQ